MAGSYGVESIPWTDYVVAFGTLAAVIVALGLGVRDIFRRRQDRDEQRELWARQVSVVAHVTAPLTITIETTNLGPSVVYNVIVEVFTVTATQDSVVGQRLTMPQLGVGTGPGGVTMNWGFHTPVTNSRIEFTDLYGVRWFRTQQGEFGRVN